MDKQVSNYLPPNSLELKRSISIPMFLRYPKLKPNREALGISPALALQVSKMAPSHANRGVRLPSSAVVSGLSRAKRRIFVQRVVRLNRLLVKPHKQDQ
jgi:hypothetical protein